MKEQPRPELWGLHAGKNGELMLGNHGTIGLAGRFGTPLHVVNEARLERTARGFIDAAAALSPGRSSVHYAMKCNSVPAVVETVLRAGAGCEVMTPYELELALRLGCPSRKIIVNGPAKSREFLDACVRADVRFIIADSLDELTDIDEAAAARGRTVEILLRVNPDFVPRGMNGGTATGSRTGCAFGLDLAGGELPAAFRLLRGCAHLRFAGVQMHIGTGIRRAEDYGRALRRVRDIRGVAAAHGERLRVLDVGGGFGLPTSREYGTMEFLASQAFGRTPAADDGPMADTIPEFIGEIGRTALGIFGAGNVPELVFEPGRCIVGGNQFLLLTVLRTKERPGAGRWIILDGGLSTVTLPTYYEHHDVIVCNDARRRADRRATLIGPACFAGDVIYKNKMMPPVRRDDVLALMDTGAYFTALESSFGFPRPAVVAVRGAECRLVRTRENFEDMTGRDVEWSPVAGAAAERPDVADVNCERSLP